MSALALSHYALRSAAAGLRRSPFVHGAAVATLAVVLFAGGLVRGGSRWLDRMVEGLGSEVELTAYLKDGTRPDDATALAEALSERASGKARVVSPDEALKRLAADLGPLGQALDGLAENPLPTSVELRLPPAGRDARALRQLASELKRVPTVDSVDYGEAAVERLASTARVLKWGALLATAVVAAIAAVIVAATLQLAIYSRRREIELQKLVGATDRFIQFPFLIQGLFQGLLGAAIAFAAILGLSAWLGPRLTEALAFLAVPGQASWVGLRLLGELMLWGALLGLAGSFLAVVRLARV